MVDGFPASKIFGTLAVILTPREKERLIAYRGESKNRQLFCLSDLHLYLYGFQSHHPLRFARVNYIKLQRKVITFTN